jgi:dual oxidase
LVLGNLLTNFFVCRIFTAEEILEIKNTTMYDIIISSTSIQPDEIQKKVFYFKDGDPCPQREQLSPDMLEQCKYLRGYDYFEVSENL